MKPEQKASQAGQDVASAMDTFFEEICGERMAFVLMIAPFDREGDVNYMANMNRDDGIAMIKNLLERWESGQPDVPLHKKH